MQLQSWRWCNRAASATTTARHLAQQQATSKVYRGLRVQQRRLMARHSARPPHLREATRGGALKRRRGRDGASLRPSAMATSKTTRPRRHANAVGRRNGFADCLPGRNIRWARVERLREVVHHAWNDVTAASDPSSDRCTLQHQDATRTRERLIGLTRGTQPFHPSRHHPLRRCMALPTSTATWTLWQ